MFKKVNFQRLNYKDLDRYDSHDQKRDTMRSFYETFDFLELVKRWPEIVGPKLAPVTSPLKIKFDSLFIVTKHSGFSHHLFELSEEIKQEIFKVFPELRKVITKLEFRTQEAFFQVSRQETGKGPVATNRLHPQSPAYKMRKIEAERLFNDINDEDLRKTMISIYIQSR